MGGNEAFTMYSDTHNPQLNKFNDHELLFQQDGTSSQCNNHINATKFSDKGIQSFQEIDSQYHI